MYLVLLRAKRPYKQESLLTLETTSTLICFTSVILLYLSRVDSQSYEWIKGIAFWIFILGNFLFIACFAWIAASVIVFNPKRIRKLKLMLLSKWPALSKWIAKPCSQEMRPLHNLKKLRVIVLQHLRNLKEDLQKQMPQLAEARCSLNVFFNNFFSKASANSNTYGSDFYHISLSLQDDQKHK